MTRTASSTGTVRILILISPSEHTMYSLLNLPPFGPGIVTAHLRRAGVQVDQRDLNSPFSHAYTRGALTKSDLAPLYQAAEVIDYVNGMPNDALDSYAATLLRGLNIEEYDVVGISAGGDFSWQEMHSAFVLGTHIQQHYGKTVAFGGNNLDYLAQFKDAFHDLWCAVLRRFRVVVTGPGEEVLLNHLDALANTGDTPASGPGVVRMLNGSVHRPPDAIHQVIPPDFDGLSLRDYANYLRLPSTTDTVAAEKLNLLQLFKWPPYLGWLANQANRQLDSSRVDQRLVIPYVFNYNCPYSCSFCTESLEQIKVVHADAGQVIDDLEYLSDHYQTPHFYFFNNYFNLRNGFLEDFASEVVTRGLDINWSDCARFNGLTPESIALLRDSGCRKLTFGLETASSSLIKVINKRVTLDEAEKVLRWCADAGIWADLEIITGLPHESEVDFDETCDFLERNAEHINFFNVNRYFVAPKSLMGARPELYGMKLRKHPEAHQRLLDANYAWLTSDAGMTYKPQNFRVYEFDEIDGRPYERIAEDTRKKIARLNDIQNDDFQEAWQMISLLHNFRGSPPARLSNETTAFA